MRVPHIACPLHEHLVTGQAPITGVLPASGGANRLREFVIDGAPAMAEGINDVADGARPLPEPGRSRAEVLALSR